MAPHATIYPLSLAEFKKEANNGSDLDVKKFAEDTSKVIQGHLDLAKDTQSKLK